MPVLTRTHVAGVLDWHRSPYALQKLSPYTTFQTCCSRLAVGLLGCLLSHACSLWLYLAWNASPLGCLCTFALAVSCLASSLHGGEESGCMRSLLSAPIQFWVEHHNLMSSNIRVWTSGSMRLRFLFKRDPVSFCLFEASLWFDWGGLLLLSSKFKCQEMEPHKKEQWKAGRVNGEGGSATACRTQLQTCLFHYCCRKNVFRHVF